MSARALVLWFLCVGALSFYSRAGVEGQRAGRCSLDGAMLDLTRSVELVTGETTSARFCSLACAESWPEVAPGAWWRVHDEVSGAPLDAGDAVYVESPIVTVRARGERRHVFAEARDALAHCEAFAGRLIPNPLAARASVSNAAHADTVDGTPSAHDSSTPLEAPRTEAPAHR